MVYNNGSGDRFYNSLISRYGTAEFVKTTAIDSDHSAVSSYIDTNNETVLQMVRKDGKMILIKMTQVGLNIDYSPNGGSWRTIQSFNYN